MAQLGGEMAKSREDQIKNANEAAVDSIERLAMRIIDIPKDKREDAFKIVRRNMEDSIRQFGQNPAAPAKRKWLDAYMGALRAKIREIEASGGGRSGHA
jgi:hypothetical protein